MVVDYVLYCPKACQRAKEREDSLRVVNRQCVCVCVCVCVCQTLLKTETSPFIKIMNYKLKEMRLFFHLFILSA